MITEQISPCPECGKTDGWWSGINAGLSMIFHERNGEVTEERITEKKRKNCVSCDADITNCVKTRK